MKKDDIIKLYDEYVMKTYPRTPLCLARGQNTKVWDSEGKEYFDFFPGWAVSGIGHCPPRVVEAVKRQADILLHVPNNYYH